jgi:hypothetical protein
MPKNNISEEQFTIVLDYLASFVSHKTNLDYTLCRLVVSSISQSYVLNRRAALAQAVKIYYDSTDGYENERLVKTADVFGVTKRYVKELIISSYRRRGDRHQVAPCGEPC